MQLARARPHPCLLLGTLATATSLARTVLSLMCRPQCCLQTGTRVHACVLCLQGCGCTVHVCELCVCACMCVHTCVSAHVSVHVRVWCVAGSLLIALNVYSGSVSSLHGNP